MSKTKRSNNRDLRGLPIRKRSYAPGLHVTGVIIIIIARQTKGGFFIFLAKSDQMIQEVKMSYEIYRITARCKCPCGKGEIIRGDSMNDWNQTRSGDIEIHCPECSNKLKFTDGGLIDINYPDYSGDPNIRKQISIIQDRIQNYKFKMTQNEMKAKRYSTELTGKSLEIAEEHRRMCYSIKLSNVLKTIFYIKKRRKSKLN